MDRDTLVARHAAAESDDPTPLPDALSPILPTLATGGDDDAGTDASRLVEVVTVGAPTISGI